MELERHRYSVDIRLDLKEARMLEALLNVLPSDTEAEAAYDMSEEAVEVHEFSWNLWKSLMDSR